MGLLVPIIQGICIANRPICIRKGVILVQLCSNGGSLSLRSVKKRVYCLQEKKSSVPQEALLRSVVEKKKNCTSNGCCSLPYAKAQEPIDKGNKSLCKAIPVYLY